MNNIMLGNMQEDLESGKLISLTALIIGFNCCILSPIKLKISRIDKIIAKWYIIFFNIY